MLWGTFNTERWHAVVWHALERTFTPLQDSLPDRPRRDQTVLLVDDEVGPDAYVRCCAHRLTDLKLSAIIDQLPAIR